MILSLPTSILASSIVIDMDNNRVLEENNMDEQRLIASTTKIMTAILAIESDRLMEVIPVGDEVLKMYGSNIYLERNEHMLLLDLVYGLMLRSGNDAAITIATFIGKTEENFVKMMNKKAKELDMTKTIYNNPHGLDEETKNYSTAHDLAILYAYAYKNATFKKIVGTKNYQTTSDLKSYEWTNRNELLFNYDKATGGKTGYTPLAGRILVSSAFSNDMNICIATIDNNSYLYEYHQTTYERIFNSYKKYLVLDKENFFIDSYNNIYLKNSYYLTLNTDEYKNIIIKTRINKKIKNNMRGQVLVYLNDELIHSESIYQKEIKMNFFDKLKEFFNNKLVFNK